MTPGDPGDTLQYRWCVEGDWKLMVRYDGRDTTGYRALHVWDTTPVHLYHLKDDPHERHDLSAQRPEVVARLKREIDAHQRAPRP